MLTCDNMRTVENALRSVTWVDEIVVVDSGSRDGTLEVARRYASRVIERPWPGFRDQYQFAADACVNDWLLFIDADEVIPEALAEEMKERLTANSRRDAAARAAGYVAPRRTWFIDRWIRHGAWKSDREVRLYNRRLGQWKGDLHACVHVDGPTETFQNVYHHYTYADVADHVKTVNRYSTTAAEDMAAAGKKTSAVKAFLGGIGRFLRDYILKRGFLDGFPGFVIAVNSGYHSFLKQVKLAEMTMTGKKED